MLRLIFAMMVATAEKAPKRPYYGSVKAGESPLFSWLRRSIAHAFAGARGGR